MKLGIMQPYFFPYLGYWQLINAVDTYVVYDNIQYTKKGWFNRNRFLQNGKDALFTIPLKKDSDYLNVIDREISEVFEKRKLISQIQNAYSKAPYIKTVMPIIENIVNYNNNNLFYYIFNSITTINNYLNITTPIVISSSIDCNHELKGQDKVLEICKAMHANTYINAIGGQKLYSCEDFKKKGIELKFLKMIDIKYPQFKNEFVANLSIIDVLMFNSLGQIKEMLNSYELI